MIKKILLIISIFFLISTNMVSAKNNFIILGDNQVFENQTFTHFSCNPSEHMRGLTILGNNTTIRNCTLIGFYINIMIKGDNNIVENNTLVGACDGVQVTLGSNNTIIRNNFFQRDNYSIVIWEQSNNTQVYNNVFYQTMSATIDLRNTSNVTINNNSFINNRYNYVLKTNEKLFGIKIFNNSYYNNLGNKTNWYTLWVNVQRDNLKIIRNIEPIINQNINDIKLTINFFIIFIFILFISIIILLFITLFLYGKTKKN